jgi:geranylgeranyl diphosphate synthase, type II
MIIEDYFAVKAQIIEGALREFMRESDHPLNEVMEYSLLSGGKRFRPIMVLAAVEALGRESTRALPAACALEYVHCFSLIHDDLPCMDNDDFRRGRPSSHRKFGEAKALLAGDALIIEAFAILTGFRQSALLRGETTLEIMRELVEASGKRGMIGGQFLECTVAEGAVNEEDLLAVHRSKTGALIRGALRIGAIIGEAAENDREALTGYGEALGLLFQIVDDVLDMEKEEPLSFPRILGPQQARKKAEETASIALASISGFNGKKEIFQDTVGFLLNRMR